MYQVSRRAPLHRQTVPRLCELQISLLLIVNCSGVASRARVFGHKLCRQTTSPGLDRTNGNAPRTLSSTVDVFGGAAQAAVVVEASCSDARTPRGPYVEPAAFALVSGGRGPTRPRTRALPKASISTVKHVACVWLGGWADGRPSNALPSMKLRGDLDVSAQPQSHQLDAHLLGRPACNTTS